MEADLVIYAGYENMVPRLTEAAGNSAARTLQIQTVHSLPIIARSVRAIAGLLGTEEEAEASLRAIRAFLDEWRAQIVASGLTDRPVVVHFHQRALAEELGLTVAGVFGPAPLEARQIDELTRTRPALIIDNGHNPVAAPIAETTGAPVATWYNFPGVAETRSIPDMLALNRAALEEVWQGE